MSTYRDGPLNGRSAFRIPEAAPEVCVRPARSDKWYRYLRDPEDGILTWAGECWGHDGFSHDEPYCPGFGVSEDRALV